MEKGRVTGTDSCLTSAASASGAHEADQQDENRHDPTKDDRIDERHELTTREVGGLVPIRLQ